MSLPIEPDHHAFPIVDSLESRLVALGLTKREYIATACMQGLLANSLWMETTDEDTNTAAAAVEYADRLIKELNK